MLTGGGTGGHIYPAISIGQAIREMLPEADILFGGSEHGPEKKIASDAGFNFVAIPSSPLLKSSLFRNMNSFGKLISGIFKAKKILNDFNPDILIGTGGYTTAAFIIAQKIRKGKVVIHEQNAVPGRTNLWLSRIADKICISFESSISYFKREKAEFTGMPIRRDFLSLPTKKEAREILGLDEDAFTILVVGGSQGAKKLNDIMIAVWSLIDDGKTQVLHQVGDKNLENVKELEIPNKYMYHLEAYIDMPKAVAAADLIISRSGASSLAEITVAGVPSILIPYPYAYADHQRHNAGFIANRGAAIVIEEKILSCDILSNRIIELRKKKDVLESMANQSRNLARPDAAKRVVKIVVDLINKSKQ
ncbi:MAG: undecaprenyldiphospho-muramoylpentapeptide beta-N-acetylglucosaminyltransferase [Armatimonadota bacterium]